MNLDDIIGKLVTGQFPYNLISADIFRDRIARIGRFLDKAEVVCRGMQIHKKDPNAERPCFLRHCGLWGYPNIILTHESTNFKVTNRFSMSPFRLYQENGCTNVSRVERLDKPSVPCLFMDENLWERCHQSDALGEWLCENHPRVFELDKQVQAFWDRKAAGFEQDVEAYINKNSPHHKSNFIQKLAHELESHENELCDMTPACLHELFQFVRKNPAAMHDMMAFLRRNTMDHIFIDEADFKVALDGSKIKKVMDE